MTKVYAVAYSDSSEMCIEFLYAENENKAREMMLLKKGYDPKEDLESWLDYFWGCVDAQTCARQILHE